MKKLSIIISFLVCMNGMPAADTIIFKDGSQIEAPKVWQEGGEVKCKMAGVVIGYPKKDVKRIIRQRQNAYSRQLTASEIEALARNQPGTCYDLGRRYGHCTTLNLYGEECPSQDDIPLPAWCKGRRDTEKGIREGIRLANKSLDLSRIGQQSSAAEASSVCFDLAKRYGKCATLSMYAQTCDPRDDIVLPLDCRGKAETKNGMRAGVRLGYKAMGYPTE